MKKTTLAASAAVLLTASTALYAVYPAFAEPGRDPMGDKELTWADAKAKADMMWTKLDVNKDGVLNEADREAKMAEMFDMIDTNHDGAISKAEFMEHHKKMMEGGWKGGKGRDGAPGDMPPPPRAAGMGMMMGPGAHMLHEMAEKADTNHDGTITRAEFDAATKARFDAADTNHDGKLTAAERRAAWMAMRGEHGGWGHGRGMHHMGGGDMGGGDMGDMPPPPPGA
ncbi:EF-hand domain-containing protein [Novosphingobium sp.]|uniref:EF-hand domain-containing protein n=1 Tax=Novosphingobium sp. TaxID=1874826 RepID=UPI003BACB70C